MGTIWCTVAGVGGQQLGTGRQAASPEVDEPHQGHGISDSNRPTRLAELQQPEQEEWGGGNVIF